jgi:hypothetical protein
VGEHLGLQGCDTVSMDKCFPTFCNITVPSPSKVLGAKKVLHSLMTLRNPNLLTQCHVV